MLPTYKTESLYTINRAPMYQKEKDMKSRNKNSNKI